MIWLGFVNHRVARAQAIRIVLLANINHISQLFGVGQAIALFVYPAIDSETVKYTHIIILTLTSFSLSLPSVYWNTSTISLLQRRWKFASSSVVWRSSWISVLTICGVTTNSIKLVSKTELLSADSQKFASVIVMSRWSLIMSLSVVWRFPTMASQSLPRRVE